MSSISPRRPALWLSALCALLTVPAALAGAASVPQNGQIAFAVQFNTEQLYSVRLDGSPVRRLTTDLAINFQAVESPDGRRLAFTRGSEGRSDIFVMNRDGSGLRNLTHTRLDDYDPMWSPDGRRIAFTSRRTGDDEAYVVNADGSNVRRVTRSRGDDENPTWLPDGQRLVISSARAGKLAQIYVVRISDGNAVRLTHEHVYDAWPQASPDGRWIAHTAGLQRGDIVLMRADGTQRRSITHGSDDDAYPAWSPDSRRLVYERNSHLWLVDRDGRHNRRLDPFAAGGNPSWGRDGTIFFDHSPYDNEEIAVVDPAGGPFRLITDAPLDSDIEPHWSSDGTQVAFESDRSGDNEIWAMRADGSAPPQRFAGPGGLRHRAGLVTRRDENRFREQPRRGSQRLRDRRHG